MRNRSEIILTKTASYTHYVCCTCKIVYRLWVQTILLELCAIFHFQEAALRAFHISESPSKFSLTEVSNAGKFVFRFSPVSVNFTLIKIADKLHRLRVFFNFYIVYLCRRLYSLCVVCMCVSAALVSTAKVMRYIQCFVGSYINNH